MSSQAIITRRSAVRILGAVVNQGQVLDTAFDKEVRSLNLSDEDKSFIRLLVTTCLRRMGQIDVVLSRLMKKPLPEKQAIVRSVLRLGATQALFLGTPPHAVANTSVEVVRSFHLSGMTGFVNGVLRALMRCQNPLEGVDVSLNFPDWLYASWQKAYGDEKARSIAESMMEVPPLDITVMENPAEWAEKWKGTVLETGSVRVSGGSPTSLVGFNDGIGWVQNAAASVPAQLFSDVQGKKVADLCAAPGGKTAQLAHFGAKVTACDISEKRLLRVRENMKRLGFSERVETIVGDALSLSEEGVFDAVLLDAPCSATGTLRRHPDLKWIRKSSDIARLADLQVQLLKKALSLVKVGGEVVFATCSLQPEEGDAVVRTVLESRLAEVMSISDRWISYQTEGGGLRFFSDEGYDGFYACLLRRTG